MNMGEPNSNPFSDNSVVSLSDTLFIASLERLLEGMVVWAIKFTAIKQISNKREILNLFFIHLFSFLFTLHEMVFGFHLKALSFFQGEDLGEVIYKKSENHFSFSIQLLHFSIFFPANSLLFLLFFQTLYSDY